jgi:retron-type reverse transcriptase
LESKLLKAVYKLDNLERAWRVIQENGRISKSEAIKLELEEFSEGASHKLRSLQVRLCKKTFEFGKAKGVPIPKVDAHGNKTGKFRPIVLAPVESRIVQRALLNVLVEIPALQPFVKTPYSFGGLRKAKEASKSSNEKQSKRSRTDNLSAVPAAIKAVLDELGRGARYIVCADIRAFFTRIPKSAVSDIIAKAVNDDEFVAFLNQAIHVELANLAELKAKVADFPTEDLGVAQGNSLSPLLGNIILAEFDQIMNEGDCRCIRYIDDFIILAPSAKAANARLRKAISLLKNLGMELSAEKSSETAQPIQKGFDFLGINISPGKIRPAAKARAKFIRSVDVAFGDARKAFIEVRNGKALQRTQSLMATLKRVDGIIDGWGKHYWFCNDRECFDELDTRLLESIRVFLGAYRDIRSALPVERQHMLLGVSTLASIDREPFHYPKTILSTRRQGSTSLIEISSGECTRSDA